jgi:REP-associated tyrosine transposase
MVAAHHLIWTVYGWWLANDPRGSSSHEIRVVELAELGPLHYGRKTIQPSPDVLRQFYEGAKDVLRHEILLFSDDEIATLGDSFREVIEQNKYTCYACAIMPEHIHLVIRRHRDDAETMIERFQKASREALIATGRRSVTHPVWGGPGWKVFLNTPAQIRGRIRYVENNPIKAGRPRQSWDFVMEYDGWMPWHPGHH